MAQVQIFSKVMNSIEYRVYEHMKDKDGKVVDSKVVDKVTINGRNSVYRASKILTDTATTLVEKALWDKIVKDYGEADFMILSGQIFEAKAQIEAVAKFKDMPSNISDCLTKADVDAKAAKANAARKLV